jgi:hypothetical protein
MRMDKNSLELVVWWQNARADLSPNSRCFSRFVGVIGGSVGAKDRGLRYNKVIEGRLDMMGIGMGQQKIVYYGFGDVMPLHKW